MDTWTFSYKGEQTFFMPERISFYFVRVQYFPIITALLYHESRFLQVRRAAIVHFSGKMMVQKEEVGGIIKEEYVAAGLGGITTGFGGAKSIVKQYDIGRIIEQ